MKGGGGQRDISYLIGTKQVLEAVVTIPIVEGLELTTSKEGVPARATSARLPVAFICVMLVKGHAYNHQTPYQSREH